MAEATEERGFSRVADPAPLGLAAFALTTFLLSGHNATFIPDGIWIGVAIFYGGLIQLLAGMWEFRNRNVFGSTAFSTYGGFWLSLGIFVVLINTQTAFYTVFQNKVELNNALAWFLVAFAIFNTYMVLWASRLNLATLAVFVTLEITEILLAIGFFLVAHGHSAWWLHAGGWAGIVTAAVAWYASAAGVVNGMSPKPVVPVGRKLWG
ncbi:MAG: acetate uptake transporter [Gaiellaceae bacterium]|jgi:succinate-acetate transporter protein